MNINLFQPELHRGNTEPSSLVECSPNESAGSLFRLANNGGKATNHAGQFLSVLWVK